MINGILICKLNYVLLMVKFISNVCKSKKVPTRHLNKILYRLGKKSTIMLVVAFAVYYRFIITIYNNFPNTKMYLVPKLSLSVRTT